jgi:glycosyltransferase involved in cell wall biosynthesis
MEHAVTTEVTNISVLHLHALWTGLSRIPNQLRENYSIPTIITPHGSLQKWALKKSRWKKNIALALYERSNLRNATCFHAVGENEIADIRDFGLPNPIAVIPNGISTYWLNSAGNGATFRQQYNIAPDRRILLFLSRVTPIKGLPMLLDAIGRMSDAFTDWCLVIAGADEFGHQAELEAVIQQQSLNSSVIMAGPIWGQEKRDAFAAADLFVLPSHSEGAPMVILEALGAGVPVLATKASPWPQLELFGCGWWADISTNSIVEALRDALDRSSDQLSQMGQRGKALVAARYTWAKSAVMTIELYEWLLHRRERPNFVVVD